MIRDLPKILFFCACAVLLGIGLAKYAKADGYERGQPSYSAKDGPSAYSYSHRPYVKKVKADSLRRYIDPEDMATIKRIKRKAERRMAAERRLTKKTSRRTRYAETGYVRSDATYRGGRECKPAIKVVSKPMATERRACEEAKKLWSVQAGDTWSGAYNDWSNARVIMVKPKPVHYGAWRDVCTVIARPCRED